jgi:hypothetical protein
MPGKLREKERDNLPKDIDVWPNDLTGPSSYAGYIHRMAICASYNRAVEFEMTYVAQSSEMA